MICLPSFARDIHACSTSTGSIQGPYAMLKTTLRDGRHTAARPTSSPALPSMIIVPLHFAFNDTLPSGLFPFSYNLPQPPATRDYFDYSLSPLRTSLRACPPPTLKAFGCQCQREARLAFLTPPIARLAFLLPGTHESPHASATALVLLLSHRGTTTGLLPLLSLHPSLPLDRPCSGSLLASSRKSCLILSTWLPRGLLSRTSARRI